MLLLAGSISLTVTWPLSLRDGVFFILFGVKITLLILGRIACCPPGTPPIFRVLPGDSSTVPDPDVIYVLPVCIREFMVPPIPGKDMFWFFIEVLEANCTCGFGF